MNFTEAVTTQQLRDLMDDPFQVSGSPPALHHVHDDAPGLAITVLVNNAERERIGPSAAHVNSRKIVERVLGGRLGAAFEPLRRRTHLREEG